MLPLNDQVFLMDYKLNKLPAITARAERHRLLSEAGLIRQPSRWVPSLWLSCQICRSLWRLGHLLVVTGQRLEERYGRPVLSPARG